MIVYGFAHTCAFSTFDWPLRPLSINFPPSLTLPHPPSSPLLGDFVAPREQRVEHVGYPDQPAQLSLELVKYYVACVIAGGSMVH